MVRPESQAIVAMIEEVVVRPDVLSMNLLVVDDDCGVAMRMRETVRQLSHEWETRNDPVRQT